MGETDYRRGYQAGYHAALRQGDDGPGPASRAAVRSANARAEAADDRQAYVLGRIADVRAERDELRVLLRDAAMFLIDHPHLEAAASVLEPALSKLPSEMRREVLSAIA